MNDALFLSRLPFRWVISFHILFPAFIIGLASWLVFLEAWWPWLPFLDSNLMARWFTWPNFLYLSPVPILTVINAAPLWVAVIRNRELAPFVLSLCFFVLGFIGLVVGIWPNIVPPP